MGKSRERKSWLSGLVAETVHHEPPKIVSRRRGASDEQVGKTGIDLTEAEHAAFHAIANKIYGWRLDDVAARGVIGNMNPTSRRQFYEIINNPQKVRKISEEIIRRRNNRPGEC